MIQTLSLFMTSFWKFFGVSSTTSDPAYIATDEDIRHEAREANTNILAMFHRTAEDVLSGCISAKWHYYRMIKNLWFEWSQNIESRYKIIWHSSSLRLEYGWKDQGRQQTTKQRISSGLSTTGTWQCGSRFNQSGNCKDILQPCFEILRGWHCRRT